MDLWHYSQTNVQKESTARRIMAVSFFMSRIQKQTKVNWARYTYEVQLCTMVSRPQRMLRPLANYVCLTHSVLLLSH